MSYGNAIQKAIYDTLTAYSPLSAAVTGVYDNVPQAIDSGSVTAFPYVTIGEDVIVEWDTDNSLGANATITVHTWSRTAGRKECKTIQGHIFDALSRQELTVTGYTLVTIEYEGEESFLDFDGETRHGVSTFRIYLDE